MTKSERPFGFMPYGASELQSVRRRYLLRGLAVASIAWIAAFAVMTVFSTWFVSAPARPVIVEPPGYYVTRIPKAEQVRVREDVAHTIPPCRAKEGIVIPVREEDAPEEVILPSDPRAYGDGQGSGEPDEPSASGGTALENPPPPTEVLPKRGEPMVADELPVLITDVKPVYPDLAREAGVEGRVIVHMLIGKDGRVLDAEIDSQNSIVMLDQAVLQATRQLVFTPAFRANRPIPVWVSRVYRFRLHGGTVE